jgi:hypothetical protein
MVPIGRTDRIPAADILYSRATELTAQTAMFEDRAQFQQHKLKVLEESIPFNTFCSARSQLQIENT